MRRGAETSAPPRWVGLPRSAKPGQCRAMNATSLHSRITQAPPLTEPKRAKAHLADLMERAKAEPQAAALLALLEQGLFRDLLLALADHSPFLWQLAIGDCIRLAHIATGSPEEVHAGIVADQAALFRRMKSGELSRDDLVRAFRRNRGTHAL